VVILKRFRMTSRLSGLIPIASKAFRIPTPGCHPASLLSFSFLQKVSLKICVCFRSELNSKPFLIDIIDVLRVNIVLWDSCLEEYEVVTIASFSVSVVTIAVHIVAPFQCEMVLVLFQKAHNPRISRLPFVRSRCVIFNDALCRWYTVPSEFFYVLHKL
jgi:hypothetical protein